LTEYLLTTIKELVHVVRIDYQVHFCLWKRLSLLQEVITNHNETIASSYARLDTGLRSSYSQLGSSSYPSSSLPSQPYNGYGSSGPGDYSTFRL